MPQIEAHKPEVCDSVTISIYFPFVPKGEWALFKPRNVVGLLLVPLLVPWLLAHTALHRNDVLLRYELVGHSVAYEAEFDRSKAHSYF